MADISVIPKVEKIRLHTNNIINWSRIKGNNLKLSSSEEVLQCSHQVINCWKKQENANEMQYWSELDVECKIHRDSIQEEERDEIRLTVKIFLYSRDPEYALQAVEAALAYLGVRDIDTVILAFPPNSLLGNNPISIEDVRFVWAALEQLVEQDRILRLGVCDFNMDQLEELYETARVKPLVNQVNMTMTCAIPEDLTLFAKENDIQLLTHNDAPDILPDSQLQEMLASKFSSRDSMLWSMRWLVRYSSVYKNRGVIRSKGYIYQAERDVKKLPYY